MKRLIPLAFLAAAAFGAEARLSDAVAADDAQAVDKLLQSGADAKAKDRYGFTALYFACEQGNPAIVKRLLDAGADPNASGPSGETALMTAARVGNMEVLRLLLDRGAAVNATDAAAHTTALMWAVRANHPEVVRLLLDKGAELDTKTRIGQTPTRRPPNAGGGSHGLGIVRGGWPDRGSQDATPGAMTALLYAARDGRSEIVQMLAKANVNQAEANGVTPLLMAITNNHLDIAKVLLDRGANVNAMDWWGRTPLWATVDVRNIELDYKTQEQATDRAASLELIKTLLDRGANVNAQTKEVVPLRRWIMPISDLSWVDFTGQTPFLRAALSGDITVMRMLIDKGADPNIVTGSKTTALMAAAGINYAVNQTYTESDESLLAAVKLCLEKGADVNAVNTMGFTALTGAVNRGSDDIVQLLVSKGARLDVKDKEGRDLMTWANGVFLATTPPVPKPSTIALLKRLTAQ